MDIKTKYGWQELYATALLETDWSKIEEQILTADLLSLRDCRNCRLTTVAHPKKINESKTHCTG